MHIVAVLWLYVLNSKYSNILRIDLIHFRGMCLTITHIFAAFFKKREANYYYFVVINVIKKQIYMQKKIMTNLISHVMTPRSLYSVICW